MASQTSQENNSRAADQSMMIVMSWDFLAIVAGWRLQCEKTAKDKGGGKGWAGWLAGWLAGMFDWNEIGSTNPKCEKVYLLPGHLI